PEEDDRVLQQARVEVERPLAAVRLLDDGRDEIVERAEPLFASGQDLERAVGLSHSLSSAVAVGGSRALRSIATPSGSTTSARSASHSSAFPLVTSERTAGI